MTKNTILCSPVIYQDNIIPNCIDLNNSFNGKFINKENFYKRGNFQKNNVIIQKILYYLYFYDLNKNFNINNYIGNIAITSSGISAAAILVLSKYFNHILYDNVYPELQDLYKSIDNSYKFTSFSQIQENDLICINSYETPTCKCNFEKIKLLVEYAHKKNAYVLVDNTIPSIYCWNPFIYNVDFVFESLGKYACGFNNALLGTIVINPDTQFKKSNIIQIFESIRFLGVHPHPIDCYLITLGLQTYSLRLSKIQQNTKYVINLLLNYKNISITTIKEYGLIYIKYNERLSIKTIIKYMNKNIKIIQYAGVFGANYTILDIFDSLKTFRLSIGIEDFEDLKPDLIKIAEFVTN